MAFSDPVNSTSSGNPLIDGLLWGMHWSDGSPAAASLAVYIAGTNGNEQFDFGGDTVTAKTVSAEVAAFRLSVQLFEAVCNIDITEVTSQSEADIILGAVNNRDADGNLGVATPPGEDRGPLSDQQGAVIINFKQYQTDDLSSLQQGGYDFISFIHEFGHAVGLKHPHDRGGAGFPKFPGVSSEFGDYGNFDLNQGVFTMMSYNDGFPTGPEGKQKISDIPSFGWEGTAMAIDIAALQYLYGANMSYHTGNDVYRLPEINQSGTFYSTIWDAGGLDTIVAGGDSDCSINLNAATLKLESGGGGVFSSHDGILGGFSIANKVTIENARGGGGDDTLIGNKSVNVLSGGEGADTLQGDRGADELRGGSGLDRFVYSQRQDSHGSNADSIKGFVQGEDVIDLQRIDADGKLGEVDSFAFIADDDFSNQAGELRFEARGERTTVILADIDGDGTADFSILIGGHHTLQSTDFML